MARPRTVLRRGVTIGLVGGATVVLSGGSAFAASPTVTNQQIVQVQMSATGQVDQAQFYSQLTAAGQGTVSVEEPMPTAGLRNLNGFGQPAIRDGKAQYTLSVDGRTQERTIASFDDARLPITVTATYLLDGQQVQPGDVVGKSGTLQVKYHVENVTGKPTKVSYQDGHGVKVDDTLNVVTPLVGQLSTVLPQSFTQIVADRAGAAGDGHGQIKLSWSMALFEPIGQTTQDFGYTARIDGGQVPAAVIQVVPVAPKDRPELKAGEDLFKDGSDAGGQLTLGATLMDASLGKLQDGAGALLGGLKQLADGADQLSKGLNTRARPGALLLANGASQARSGAAQLSNGFNSPTGAPDLVTGSKELAAGLASLSDGLSSLSTQTGLPKAYAATLALRAGVDALVAGLGSATTSDSVLNGLAQLRTGSAGLSAGVTQLQGAADLMISPTTGLPAAKDGVDGVKGGLDAALAPGGSIDQLKGGIAAAKATAGCTADPTCAGTLTAVGASVDGSSTSLRASTAGASGGLGAVSAGLGAAIAGIGTGSTPGALTLRGGLAGVAAGLTQSAAGLGLVTDGVNQVKAGLKSGHSASPGIAEGLNQLAEGLLTSVGGVGQLASGAQTASTGSSALADSIVTAGGGVDQLAGGLGAIETGARSLSSGIGDAATGASDLATGARSARHGSGLVAGGLSKLREQGIGVLVSGGNDTTKKYAEKYAMMQALDDRAQTDALPYGPSVGTTSDVLYLFKLGGETGAGEQNLARGGAATAIFAGAGVAGVFLRRRQFGIL
jgi:putative membrane protein